ncbi:hypothetical protein CBFG_00959 [Clostridiales bacterium 1_7_47FAA]|nr:hypothetical protein CBFG_00959 [Clostridiales bacterium 1_7_47FAA]
MSMRMRKNISWSAIYRKTVDYAFFQGGVKEYENAGKIKPAMFAPCELLAVGYLADKAHNLD